MTERVSHDPLEDLLCAARTDEPGFPLDAEFTRRTAAAMATMPSPRRRGLRAVAWAWTPAAVAGLCALAALAALFALVPGTAEGLRALADGVAWVRFDIVVAVLLAAVSAEQFAA